MAPNGRDRHEKPLLVIVTVERANPLLAQTIRKMTQIAGDCPSPRRECSRTSWTLKKPEACPGAMRLMTSGFRQQAGLDLEADLGDPGGRNLALISVKRRSKWLVP